MKWLRILIFLFVALTIAYVMVWFRAQRREKARLKSNYAKSEKSLTERDYVAVELEKYNRGLKPKMLLFVYIVPFILSLFLLYLANI